MVVINLSDNAAHGAGDSSSNFVMTSVLGKMVTRKAAGAP